MEAGARLGHQAKVGRHAVAEILRRREVVERRAGQDGGDQQRGSDEQRDEKRDHRPQAAHAAPLHQSNPRIEHIGDDARDDQRHEHRLEE